MREPLNEGLISTEQDATEDQLEAALHAAYKLGQQTQFGVQTFLNWEAHGKLTVLVAGSKRLLAGEHPTNLPVIARLHEAASESSDDISQNKE